MGGGLGMKGGVGRLKTPGLPIRVASRPSSDELPRSGRGAERDTTRDVMGRPWLLMRACSLQLA
eukprot:1385049-Prymnesium_polylepis.1